MKGANKIESLIRKVWLSSHLKYTLWEREESAGMGEDCEKKKIHKLERFQGSFILVFSFYGLEN